MNKLNKCLGGVGVLLLMLLCLSGCDDARKVWNDGIKKCAQNDQLGPNVIFFGPSNTIGPGSIFTVYPDRSIQVSDLPEDYKLPANAILPGAVFSCEVLRNSGFGLDAKVPLTEALGVPAEIGLSLQQSKSRNIKAASVEWVELAVGRFKDHVGQLPAGNTIKQRLLNGDKVLARALRVNGFEATLTYSSEIAPKVKAAIPSVIGGGPEGVELSASWVDNQTLVIKSTSFFYIAGELRTYSVGGLASEEIGELVPDQARLKLKRH